MGGLIMNETSGGGSGSERRGAEIAASVLDFYKELPFNYRQSAAQHAKTIRRTTIYPMW
jgi:hypothetical protein